MSGAVWLLVVIITNGAGNGSYRYHNSVPMPFSECQEAAKTFKASIPSGGDSEQGVAVVCVKGKLGRSE